MKTREALQKARDVSLDLVIIADAAKPPVAKILDFNKFLYEERKKASSIKAKSRKSELKELRFGPSIGEGDLNQRIERAKKFIEQGNRVKITIKLRGRERAHPEVGFEKINKFKKELSEIAKEESEAKLQGNVISTIFINN